VLGYLTDFWGLVKGYKGGFMKGRVVIALGLGLTILFSTILIDRARPTLPQLEGTLIYHRYSNYSAWDATMWMVDLPTGKMTQVGQEWSGMFSPINAHFSADGQAITFMGSATGLPENDWDVFVSRWKNGAWQEPVNLTGPNGARDEDPKFSPIENTIVYKEDGVLAKVSIDGGTKSYLTKGEEESSMPYYRSNGVDILFERGGDIYLLQNGNKKKMYAGDGLSSYYPIGINEKSFLYTRIQSNKHDSIQLGFYDGSPSKKYFFNSTEWDTSDPYPYNDASRFIFFVSGDDMIFHGGYNLAMADLKKTKVYSIDEIYLGKRDSDINSDLHELGPAWTAVRFTK
jgi:hypothetical protein